MYTAIQIENLSKKEGSTLVAPNLRLKVTKTGASWYFCGRINGKNTSRKIGAYPAVSYREAQDIARNVAPKRPATQSACILEDAYCAWAEKKKLRSSSFAFMDLRIRKHILPKFGKVKLEDLTPKMLIEHWKPLEQAGNIETIRKLCVYIKDIAILAQNIGLVETMPDLTHLKSYYPPKAARPMPAINPKDLSELFFMLEKKPRFYSVVWLAFMAQFYTLSRPKEVAYMRWDWVDYENYVIHFPAEIMKTRRPHDVPITKQMRALLNGISKTGDYVFNNPSRPNTPISSESVRLMLSKAGLKGIQSAHGIRAIGSTWLAEQGYPEEVCEACLAHVCGSKVRRAYQRSDFLEKRRSILQAWCDYVDRQRERAHDRIRKLN